MLKCFVKKYTYWRIKEIFLNDYHLTISKVFIYKGERYNQPARYNLIDENNNIVVANVTLDALRENLTKEDYPLTDKE